MSFLWSLKFFANAGVVKSSAFCRFYGLLFYKKLGDRFASYKNKTLRRALLTLSYQSIVASCHKRSENF